MRILKKKQSHDVTKITESRVEDYYYYYYYKIIIIIIIIIMWILIDNTIDDLHDGTVS